MHSGDLPAPSCRASVPCTQDTAPQGVRSALAHRPRDGRARDREEGRYAHTQPTHRPAAPHNASKLLRFTAVATA